MYRESLCDMPRLFNRSGNKTNEIAKRTPTRKKNHCQAVIESQELHIIRQRQRNKVYFVVQSIRQIKNTHTNQSNEEEKNGRRRNRTGTWLPIVTSAL